MIRVTRLDGSQLYLNSDLIESVESTPDTVVRLTTQKRLLVREPAPQVVAMVLHYRRLLARARSWRGQGKSR